MYIKSIKINNYRNFNDFYMEFHDGLNVIIGSNNSGKTGLLYAINLIKKPDSISIDDFNKNNLLEHFDKEYKEVPPEIIIEYNIQHKIFEENTNDESIIKLISFLGMDRIEKSKKSADDSSVYTIVACVKMKYSLDSKEVGRYVQAVSSITKFDDYYQVFKLFQEHYSWSYSNGISDTSIDKKEATDIFEIDFIEAERKSEAVYMETKREIKNYLKTEENIAAMQKLEQDISKAMKENIKPVLTRIEELIEKEDNNIGLAKGNVAIQQDVRPNVSISDSYVIDVKDTKSDYIIPLTHNGLGYNNLINMFMIIRLVEIKKGKDFRILCLEEPEAHLHPAMQYKLFKFLKHIDDENNLNQQIFVTTHSSNITAVAGLDNMFMLAYNRNDIASDCKQQSLKKQFENESDAKQHMMKFLDVTRSDMLFADKVIFVEGIAEKLLLPKFMEKCKYAYEDEHVSIVEIGGKHFEHFIKMFANNAVKKKVLCITDKDFRWIKSETETTQISDYASYKPNHIKSLETVFPRIDNLKICSQTAYGQTFEDELFLSNLKNENVAVKLLKIALGPALHPYIDANKVNFYKWCANKKTIDGRSNAKISKLLDVFKKACINFPKNRESYKQLFFAELFLSYAKDRKGDVALSILVDDGLMKDISVPKYIEEGIKWLSI